MTNEITSALKGCIDSIQLKLSDYVMEKIDFERILKERLTTVETPRNVNQNLNLLEEKHFEYVNPVCPSCSSHKIIKDGFRARNPILAEFGPQKIYQQRYKCNSCHKRFTTSLDSVIKPRHRYANICEDKAKYLIETGARSLRKTAEDFYTFFNFLPSHQTIQKWIQTGVKNKIHNKKLTYSGYYVYDEQYIKIKGKKHYRLTIYDFILNVPIAEEIVLKLGKKVIYNFIKQNTQNKPFYALTTDLVPEYKTITDKLGVIHQQCIFHFTKMVNKPVFKILRDKITDKQDKIRLLLYATELKNVFRTFDEKTAIERLESFIEKFDDIPKVLQQIITKTMLPNFQRLTQFMRHNYISRTSNPNENYYRQTDPEQIKKKYKKIEGFLNYTHLKMQYWTKKHGKIPNTH